MQCFVIMPFDQPFDDVYDSIKTAVENAVPGEKLACRSLAEVRSAGRITDDLVAEIRHCDLCVADLTGNNPNVLWEVGYAMALQKPTVFVSQDIEHLPFDIKDMRVLEYSRERLAASLREPLAESVRATLARYAVPRELTHLRPPASRARSIALTGSSDANPRRVERRLAALLSPYLSSDTLWYCGSSGVADEVNIRYLLGAKQKVVVVGYDQYDVSAQVLQLVEEHELPFLDPEQLSLPGGRDAPNARDVLFASRADLVVLVWNGKSRGIGAMVDWYKANAKDFLLAFV